jgi:predicted transcriptional regulator
LFLVGRHNITVCFRINSKSLIVAEKEFNFPSDHTPTNNMMGLHAAVGGSKMFCKKSLDEA